MRISAVHQTTVAGLVAALTLGLPLAGAGAASSSVDDDLAKVRAATEKYKDPAVAVAAGYKATDHCVLGPKGTMGFHYFNEALAKNGHTDITKPPLMIYQPTADGGRQLVAVEWFKVDDDQDLATDSDKPSLFGTAFDGPMEGHEPGMPRHYDLHAWIYQNNASGTFAQYNPAGSCKGAPHIVDVSKLPPAAPSTTGGGAATASSHAKDPAGGGAPAAHVHPKPAGGAATGFGSQAESSGSWWLGAAGAAGAAAGIAMIGLGWRRQRES